MFQKLEVMQTSQAMARHAAQRQTLVARNVANADTPGFRARDLVDFAETYRVSGPSTALLTTRAAHLVPAERQGGFDSIDSGAEASPSGNTVSLEDQMIKSVELRQQHDMAMAIFAKARDILRASIGRGN